MRRTGTAALATIVFATAAGAQRGAPLPTLEPRTLVGIVTDTSGNPIDSAEVRIESTRRTAFTRADGTFAFEDVNVARYSVTARKVGYGSSTIRVAVPRSGAAVRFELGQYIRGLAPSVTVASRNGIAGVVSDTSLRPLAGAVVYAMGSTRQVTTDSAGGFYLDVTPGRYLLRVSRDGFRSQLASVHVPENEGRRVAVWLTESSVGSIAREAAVAFDLNERLVMASGPFTKLYTREDMAAINVPEMHKLASIGAARRVDDACDAVIDGGPQRAPLWTLNANDVEFVEVYTPRPQRRSVVSATRGASVRGTIPGPTGGVAAAAASRSAATSLSCVTVYVWLRK